ncbi:lipoprotein [Inhella sp. 4Y17]|uniref:Lipoprotein n=2 Tax=Inhella gelatinilytica TaxID=2795030 RepID=A0A931NDB4_9BURK|nr:lipoprotein [Inhella gelatinilytica]
MTLSLALSLAACGQKGPLKPPSSSPTQQPPSKGA